MGLMHVAVSIRSCSCRSSDAISVEAWVVRYRVRDVQLVDLAIQPINFLQIPIVWKPNFDLLCVGKYSFLMLNLSKYDVLREIADLISIFASSRLNAELISLIFFNFEIKVKGGKYFLFFSF